MYKIIKNWEEADSVSSSCYILKKGGIIVYPTDTIYGLGCDATNEHAIKKINLIKRRQTPISVMVSSQTSIENWFNIEEKHKNKLLKNVFSSDTYIIPIKENIVSKLILGDDNSLGIRKPRHQFCNKLSANYPNPITTTSVNRTGEPYLKDPKLIYNIFKDEIDLIIEDGILDNRGSKIYKFKKGNFICLRS
jgi:L-threonylcarbamoyladenylate synthase